MRSRGVISLRVIAPLRLCVISNRAKWFTQRRQDAKERQELICHQFSVTVRAAIAEELPRISHFANHVEIQIGHDQRILISRRLRNDLSARVAEITLAIKLADVPGLLVPDAIDRTDEIAVRDRMRRLLQLPQILRQTGDRS